MDSSDTGAMGFALPIRAVDKVLGTNLVFPIFGLNWSMYDEGFVVAIGFHNWGHCSKKWAPIQKTRSFG